MQKDPKIAIVCDWLTNLGGAERVILDMYKAFPEADIFTSIYNPQALPQFKTARVHTSYLQNFPFAKSKHFLYITMMPKAFESFDLRDYDIVLSSSFACSKGVITKPETIHICYCHTPMRYVWDQSHKYINEHGVNSLLKKMGKPLLHKLRLWDKLASQRVDKYIANSDYVAKRIKKYYEYDSTIIHPGIDISQKPKNVNNREDFYLAAGRLKAYKKFDLIVEAFNKLEKKLYIVGTGEHEKHLKSINTNKKTYFLGFVEEKILKKLYSEAQALIFPQCEDFGITPLEAQLHGCPIIAYKKGGILETTEEDKTSILFEDQSVEAIIEAVHKSEKKKWNHENIQKNALKFSSLNFQNELKKYVEKNYSDHRSKTDTIG